MTNGTSQGLFVVVAIVIFGIFIGLSYTIFGSEGLSNNLKELFTNATEQSNDSLLAGKDLIREYDMTVTTHNVTVLHREENDIKFNSTGTYFSGVTINSNYLKPAKGYSLNFKLKKIDGVIGRIGGHIDIASEFKIYINDELQVVNREEETIANDFSYGVPYTMKDGEIISVRVEFITDRYNQPMYPDRPLKIQPNRKYISTGNGGFDKPYTAEITEIQLQMLN